MLLQATSGEVSEMIVDDFLHVRNEDHVYGAGIRLGGIGPLLGEVVDKMLNDNERIMPRQFTSDSP